MTTAKYSKSTYLFKKTAVVLIFVYTQINKNSLDKKENRIQTMILARWPKGNYLTTIIFTQPSWPHLEVVSSTGLVSMTWTAWALTSGPTEPRWHSSTVSMEVTECGLSFIKLHKNIISYFWEDWMSRTPRESKHRFVLRASDDSFYWAPILEYSFLNGPTPASFLFIFLSPSKWSRTQIAGP